MNIWNVVSQMLMMLAMLAVGYGAAKLHIVTQEGNRTLSAILLSIAFPCMVLSSVSAPGERDDMLLVWSLIAGVVLFTALPLLAWVLVKVTRIGGNEESAWETMLYLPNVAFMGIPVAGAIWGNTAVLIVAIMNLVFSFLLFGVAAIHFGRAADKKKVDGIVGVRRFPWRALLSPSMLASYAALIIYICRIPVPGTLGGTFSYLGAMTTPLSMMISGVNLAAMPLRQVFGNGKTYVMSFLRLIVMPLALYPLFRLLLARRAGVHRALGRHHPAALCAYRMARRVNCIFKKFRSFCCRIFCFPAARIFRRPPRILIAERKAGIKDAKETAAHFYASACGGVFRRACGLWRCAPDSSLGGWGSGHAVRDTADDRADL